MGVMYCDCKHYTIMQTNGPFVVNHLTGVISLGRALDYDVATSHDINVRAQVRIRT